MTAPELKELYLKGELTPELQTAENLCLLLGYEIQDHKDKTGNDIYEYNEIIQFCREKLMEIPPEERNQHVYKYIRNVGVEQYVWKLLKKKRTIVILGVLIFCILFTGRFIAYSINMGMFGFNQSNGKEESIKVEPTTIADKIQQNENYFTWLPKGYDLKISSQENTAYGKLFIYEYIDKSQKIITLRIQELSDETFSIYAEKNTEDMKIFIVNGIHFYTSMNKNLNQILWTEDHYYHSLYGDTDMNILENIIKKNYK